MVETANFTDVTQFRGSSAAMKVTERFTMLDRDTIQYRFTVDDPATWARPWSAEIPLMRTEDPIYEYACHEGNYGLPNILRAQRVADAATEVGAAFRRPGHYAHRGPAAPRRRRSGARHRWRRRSSTTRLPHRGAIGRVPPRPPLTTTWRWRLRTAWSSGSPRRSPTYTPTSPVPSSGSTRSASRRPTTGAASAATCWLPLLDAGRRERCSEAWVAGRPVEHRFDAAILRVARWRARA